MNTASVNQPGREGVCRRLRGFGVEAGLCVGLLGFTGFRGFREFGGFRV